MGRERSDKSRYASKYGGGWVTEAQYLAETACERMALAKGQRLAFKFWNLPKWKKPYALQLRFGLALLKAYSMGQILSTLRKHDRVYSLGAKFLPGLIQQEEAAVAASPSKEEVVPVGQPTEQVGFKAPPVFVNQPSVADRLKDL